MNEDMLFNSPFVNTVFDVKPPIEAPALPISMLNPAKWTYTKLENV